MKHKSEVFAKTVCAILLCGTSYFVSSYGYAQKITSPEPIEVRDPRLKEGRFFTVEVRPSGRQMQVKIAGKEMATLDFAKVDMSAKLHLRDRTMHLTPTREAGTFMIENPVSTPENPGALDLNIEYGEKAEQFRFDLNRIR